MQSKVQLERELHLTLVISDNSHPEKGSLHILITLFLFTLNEMGSAVALERLLIQPSSKLPFIRAGV